MNLNQFEEYSISAWLFGDGVTSRHVEVRTPSKSKRHGKLTKVIFGIGSVLIVSGTLTISSAADAATDFNLGSSPEVSTDAEKGFAKSSADLIARFNANKPIVFSAETMALAGRAVERKVNFSEQSIDDWAKKLVTGV